MINLVFPGQKRNFEYKYGACFRDKSLANSDRNISNVGEDFDTKEERKVMGAIAIREAEILMSGKEMFLEYTTQSSGSVRNG